MKKKLLAALLVVCMVAAMLVPASAATTFDDVDADAWYAGSIERWTGNGILNGKGDGKFDPTGPMKRAEFAKVIVELLGLAHDSKETTFDDAKDHWAVEFIVAANKAGIINGYPDGKFAPESPVTFDQSAAMLARATGLVEPGAYGADVTAKLDELGVLDDHVKAGAEANRALVAALADNLIGAYVTPDTIETETEDGVITGTKGVILVKGDVEVKIEDAKVGAIVMQGGNVTLSGETTVDTVKVGGEKAAVTADEGTTVGAVTVEGTDAAVELNGKVENVTVTEDATVAELKGDGVTKDIVTNESAADIDVNGETVEAKPADETPDDNTGDDEAVSGVIPVPVNPPADNDELDAGETVEDTRTGTIPAANSEGAMLDDSEKDSTEGHVCKFEGEAEVTGEATCSAAGSAVYTCTASEACKATKTVTIAQLPHEFTRKSFDSAHHSVLCKYCEAADAEHTAYHNVTGPNANLTVTNYGTKHTITCSGCDFTLTADHAQSDPATEASWDTTNAQFHWKVCGTEGCGAKFGQAVHTWGEWEDGATANGKTTQTRTCDDCGKTQTRQVDATEGDDDEGDEHVHEWATAWENNDTHHWHACTGSDCELKTTAPTKVETGKDNASNLYAEHAWAPKDGSVGTKACSCGKELECTQHNYDKDATEPTGKCTLCATVCTHGNTAAGEQCETCGQTKATD